MLVLIISGKELKPQMLCCLDNLHYQHLPRLHRSLMARPLRQIKTGMLGQRPKTGVLMILVVTGVALTPQLQQGTGRSTKLIEATIRTVFFYNASICLKNHSILNNFWWCNKGRTIKFSYLLIFTNIILLDVIDDCHL